MYNNTRQIEVKGKKYTLTVKRSIVFKIAEISPEILRIWKDQDKHDMDEDEKLEVSLSLSEKLYDNMNVLFYEMIKVAHPDITLEKSNEIYDAFYNEYNDVDEKLMDFIQTVFTGSVPRENKKDLNW